jgi:phosphoserine phosphatase
VYGISMTGEVVTIFDVDGTMLDGPTTVAAFAMLRQAKMLSPDAAEELPGLLEVRADDPVKFMTGIGIVLGRELQLLGEGKSPEELDAVLRKVTLPTAEHWRQMIFPEMREELSIAKVAGHVGIISRGPDPFIRVFAEVLGVNGGFGRSAEEYADRTKRLEKPALFEQLLEERKVGYGRGTSRLVVYGDTGDDLPLLDMATDAYAVNPRGELREKASERGWRIIDCKDSGKGEYGSFGDLAPTIAPLISDRPYGYK